VAHAVAKFRGRAATREDKRLAVVALIGILEERRQHLKSAGLSKKDDGALFDIANNFDLRHRNIRQHGDYDEAFLEWLFWWYLATVDLTDRLLARQASGSPASST
jgi:predicted DNA-binding ribbon-helix-helix protein